MTITLYERLDELSRKSVNGQLLIITKDGDEIADLCWEDIVDIEHALKLAKEIQDGRITLTPKYRAVGLNNLDHLGENINNALKKFKFLLEYFVGHFDY